MIIRCRAAWLFPESKLFSHACTGLRKRLASVYAGRQAVEEPPPVPGTGCKLLDGKGVATAWIEELQDHVQDFSRAAQRAPGLAVVLVGDRLDSLLYVSRKQEVCAKVGIRSVVHRLVGGAQQAQLETVIKAACVDPTIDGVLIQLPLPRHLDEEKLIEVLDPRKDVDGFHPLNVGRTMMRGHVPRFVPCTPLGCMQLLVRSGVEIRGTSAVVLGDSNIVGTPMAGLLRSAGAATVTVCSRPSYQKYFEDGHRAAADVCLPRLPGPQPADGPSSHVGHVGHADYADQQLGADGAASTRGLLHGRHAETLPLITRTADLLVVAVGHPELVRSHWVKPGAVVLDVGINVVPRNWPMQDTAQRPPSRASTSAVDSAVAGGEAPSVREDAEGRLWTRRSAAKDHCCRAASRGGTSAGTTQVLSDQGPGEVARGSTVCEWSCSDGEGGGGNSGAAAAAVGGVMTLPHDWRIVGDVAFDEVSNVASALSPVPGGVGPMTIAALVHNTLAAARYHVGMQRW